MRRKLILTATLFVVAASAATAGQKTPSLVGLARATAAEQHCNTLLATEKLELERATEARRSTEAAAAPAIAQQMYEEGTATGAKARCDATTARAIKSVLMASRNSPPAKVPAMAAEPPVAAAETAPKAEAPAPVVKAEIKPQKAPKPAILNKPVRPVLQRAPASLAAYGSLVESYYRELRCPTMSTSSVNGFYHEVLRAHQKAVRDFGVGPASTAVRRAEIRANAGSC